MDGPYRQRARDRDLLRAFLGMVLSSMGDLGHHDRDNGDRSTTSQGRRAHRAHALPAWRGILHARNGRGDSTDGPGPLLALVFFLPIVAIGLSGALNWNMEDE